MYGRNTFEFSNAWTLSYLQSTILRHRWDSIRQIEIKWNQPSGRVQDSVAYRYYRGADQIVWESTCGIIKDMESLKHFTLQVSGLQVLSTKWSEFLGPLRHLSLNRTWEIQLPREGIMARFLPTIKGALEREGVPHTVRMQGERLQATANYSLST